MQRICILLLIICMVACQEADQTVSSLHTNAPIINDTNNIIYFRHEPHYDPVEIKGRLLSFVYDIPYFGGCGVFPPLHIINQTFATGGGDGGMSPGASWQPFSLNQQQYDALLNEILDTSVITLENQSRYNSKKFIFDHSFDHYSDELEWLTAACNKHRLNYYKKALVE